MDPLTVAALSPATLNAVNGLRPVKTSDAPVSNTVTIQDLAQGLFQRSLQAATLSPLAEPAAGSLGLAQEATASLLAALNAPQAPAAATPAANATTLSAAVQAPADATTAPSPTPPTLAITDLPAAQDTFATSSSTDFAMQAALRFGAGVAGAAAPATAMADQGAGLVRDATSVIRTGSLQPQAGGPGPEAFLLAQANLNRILRTYQPEPAGPQPVGLDLMA